MTAPASPPQRVFETSDRDQASEYLTASYGTVCITGYAGPFSFRNLRMATDTFSLENATHSGTEIDYTLESVPILSFVRSRTVIVDYWSAGTHPRFGPGELCLFSRHENDASYRVRVGRGAVQSVALPFTVPAQGPLPPRHSAWSRSGSLTGFP
ncbi:hypothetical protein [Amycolatopsis sp. NPDC058986]|uniref:hypothetical protein n=1 Tax=unclassified Amycolatopsis TaxID=2618356 RepID=UPI00366B074B